MSRCFTFSTYYLCPGVSPFLPITCVQVCKLNPDAGTCRGYEIHWYYDSSVQRCQRFVYTGCQGNGNRFASENECLDFCHSGGVDTVITPAPTLPSGGESAELHVHALTNPCTFHRGEGRHYFYFIL